ncbi:nucleoporin autopeptidase-domain-containing protein [Pilobolus umbonatus]|nr:nucleoporin autopeptidase-domain-containing protein [Pilobolus umbonatus]
MFGKSTFGNTGGFGQQQQTQPTNSVFGQPQPQQTNAFGGFGANTTGGAFGATNTATPGAFGQPAQTTAFGATNTGTFGQQTSAFGQPRTGGFGAPTTGFGAAAPTTNTGFGGFGSAQPATTSAFGSNTPAAGGLFGQRPTTTAFGATNTTSAFGQPITQPTSTFGGMGMNNSAFGQTANVSNQGTAAADFSPTQDRDVSTGVNNFFQTITAMPQYKNYSLEELRFQDYAQGRKSSGNATTAFGATAAPAFGAAPTTFGQAAQPTGFGQTGGAFGQNTQTNAFGQSNTTGLFNQQQPQTGFGQPAAGATTGFGSNMFGNTNTATGFGTTPATNTAFGATNTSKPFSFGNTPAAAPNAFGATTTPGFGQQQTTNAFGQPAANNTMGGFGQKPATTGGFGLLNNTTNNANATTGFGAMASKPTTSFAFNAAAPATGNTGFGFGATTTPTSIGFGQNTSGTGIFGAAKPAAPTTSFFNSSSGTNPAGTTGFSFGQQPQTGATSGFSSTGTMFGQKPATGLGTTGNIFGGNTTSFNTGTGGFGFGQQQQQGQFNLPAQGGLTSFGTTPLPNMQPLVAAVDKNPYGNNPLFDLNKVQQSGDAKAPSAVALDGSIRKTHNSHYPISPRVVSKIKLRGFSFTPAGKSTQPKAQTSTLQDISDDAVLGSGAFAPRPTNKKLMFDNTVDAANIVALVNQKADKRKVLFDPQLEYIATSDNTNPAPSTSANVSKESPVSSAMKNGYYMIPSLESLSAMSKDSLKSVPNLIIGRSGYAEVKFDRPVDLSDVPLDEIMGVLVVIEHKQVTIYPNSNKPIPGKGLNVPATIKLECCYCLDKNTGARITDPEHPRYKLFIERMRNRPNTDFISYDGKEGIWVFRVHEF